MVGLPISWLEEKRLALADWTETDAEPETPEAAAVTAKGPPTVAAAVKRPETLIVPPPVTDQVKAGVWPWGRRTGPGRRP